MTMDDGTHVDPEETRTWALRWKAAWEANWPTGTLHNVLPLYHADAEFRSIAHREADVGHAAIGAVFDTFQAGASNLESRFAEPLVEGSRAVLEWWACWTEDGHSMSMAGCTSLWFDASGLVVASRNYWNVVDGASGPYEGW